MSVKLNVQKSRSFSQRFSSQKCFNVNIIQWWALGTWHFRLSVLTTSENLELQTKILNDTHNHKKLRSELAPKKYNFHTMLHTY